MPRRRQIAHLPRVIHFDNQHPKLLGEMDVAAPDQQARGCLCSGRLAS